MKRFRSFCVLTGEMPESVPAERLCASRDSPLQRVHALVDAVDGVCDALELLALVHGLGVGAAHAAEHVAEREVHRAVLLLGAVVELAQEAHDASRLLLGSLQCLLLRVQLLFGK